MEQKSIELNNAQKSLVVSHYLHHRAPAVVYRRLWPSGAPITPSQFVRLYCDAVIEFLNPIGEHAKAALDETTKRNFEVLCEARDYCLDAIKDVVSNPLGPADERGRCEDRMRLLGGLLQALASIIKQIREIRTAQLDEAAKLHSLLMSNAGADDGD